MPTTNTVSWTKFLKIKQAICDFSAKHKEKVHFWSHVLNPRNETYIPEKDFRETLELLSRTKLTSTKTTISSVFTNQVWDKLKELDALKPLEDEETGSIVAKKFNELLDKDHLSLEVFE